MNEENSTPKRGWSKIWATMKSPMDNKKLLVTLIASNLLVTIIFGWLIWDFTFGPDSEEYDTSGDSADLSSQESEDTGYQDSSDSEDDSSTCNVVGINLHGQLVTYISNDNISDSNEQPIVDQTASESVVSTIKWAEQAENIKAIVLEVDSYGGSGVAGEEIADALKSSKKPVIAYIRDVGASAAYLAATGANTIYASAMSDVGGMGITMSYLDYAAQNKKDGRNYNQLSIGQYKDTGSEDKALTAEEKKVLMQDLQRKYDIYVKEVASNRKMNITNLLPMANGLTYNGDLALEMGLIDKIGGYLEVNDYLKSQILNSSSTDGSTELDYCWY